MKPTSLLDIKDPREHIRELSALQEPLVLPTLSTISNCVDNETVGSTDQLISLGSEAGNPATSCAHHYETDLMEFPELDIIESDNPSTCTKISCCLLPPMANVYSRWIISIFSMWKENQSDSFQIRTCAKSRSTSTSGDRLFSNPKK